MENNIELTPLQNKYLLHMFLNFIMTLTILFPITFNLVN